MAFFTVMHLVALCLAASVYRISRMGKREPNLPPGPPTVPILGNLHIFPREKTYLQFTAWAKKYGGIMSLKIGPGTMIVVSDARVSRELIDQKSINTSDRPPNHFVNLITDGTNVGLVNYSQFWRRGRRIMQTLLSKEACEHHLPIHKAEAIQLMHDLLSQPEEFVDHIMRYSNSVLTSVWAGTRSPRPTSPIVSAFHEAQGKWTSLLEPGAHPPVDVLPILKYVPARWAPWKGICKDIRSRQFKLYEGLIELCERRIAKKTRTGCALEIMLDEREETGDTLEIIRGTCAALMEGGSDTTSLFLQNLVLLLVSHPEVQVKAQQELDAMVGCDRIPDLEDIKNLPYLQAIIKEVLRLRPPVPLGVPHYTSADETVNGFLIPKGCIIFINQWAMLHDPEIYDQPDAFKPDRFLTSEFGTKPGVDLAGRRNDLHFGGGRRICVGINLANDTFMLNTMNLLWAFELKKAIDPITKQSIPVDINNYSTGLVARPNPFKCGMHVRSPTHAAIIEQEFKTARPVFQQFEHDLSEDALYIRSLD